MTLLPKRILPVLMYHRIGDVPDGDPRLWIPEQTLVRHLRWIRDRGLRTLSLDEAYECFHSQGYQRKAVLITFDDAFAETLSKAAPLLEEYGMRSAVFVPAGLLGHSVTLGPPGGPSGATSAGRIVDQRGLQQWIAAGQEVGSHSLSHLDLTTVPAETVQLEAAQSRDRLEEVVEHPVLDFCYPFAHHDAKARRIVADAGYRAAYAGEPPTSDLFAIPRMMIYPTDTERRFARKLSGYYYWISAWHRRITRSRPHAQHRSST